MLYKQHAENCFKTWAVPPEWASRSQSVHSMNLKHPNRIQSLYFSLCGIKNMKSHWSIIAREDIFYCLWKKAEYNHGKFWPYAPSLWLCKGNSLQKTKISIAFTYFYTDTPLPIALRAKVMLLSDYCGIKHKYRGLFDNTECIKVYKVIFCPVRVWQHN